MTDEQFKALCGYYNHKINNPLTKIDLGTRKLGKQVPELMELKEFDVVLQGVEEIVEHLKSMRELDLGHLDEFLLRHG